MQEDNIFARAIQSAKTLIRFDVALFAFAIVIAVEWWLASLLPDLGSFAWFVRATFLLVDLIWFLPLAAIINWFISHGGLETNDAEFIAVRKSLIMSFLLWLAANALNLLLLNYRGWLDFQ